MIPTLTWTLPRPPKSRYKGGFPLFFEENLVKLLGYPDAILQPFGGRAEHGVRMDLDALTEPDIVGDAHDIPYPDESFDTGRVVGTRPGRTRWAGRTRAGHGRRRSRLGSLRSRRPPLGSNPRPISTRAN